MCTNICLIVMVHIQYIQCLCIITIKQILIYTSNKVTNLSQLSAWQILWKGCWLFLCFVFVYSSTSHIYVNKVISVWINRAQYCIKFIVLFSYNLKQFVSKKPILCWMQFSGILQIIISFPPAFLVLLTVPIDIHA